LQTIDTSISNYWHTSFETIRWQFTP
jgi:hypothetical protein